jgi:hypothetical protein
MGWGQWRDATYLSHGSFTEEHEFAMASPDRGGRLLRLWGCHRKEKRLSGLWGDGETIGLGWS